MNRRLDGRAVVVTGGAAGIGRSIVAAFLREGAKVLIADIDGAAAIDTAKALSRIGPVFGAACDVTSMSDAQGLVLEARDRFGVVNVLINNAGLSARAFLEEFSEETIDALLAVNLKGTILCTQAFSKALVESGDAAIIYLSSQAAKRGWPENSVYSAAKAGVLGFNRAIAIELAPEVRVNAICPGFINEEGMAWRGWELRSRKEGGTAASIGAQFAKENVPLQRLQRADDIANAAVFLASAESKEITGAALNVGGGVVMD